MLQKLKTAEERKAKEERTKMIFSIFMVLILMMSVISFALIIMQEEGSNNDRTEYNKHSFVYSEEGWKTSVESSLGDYYLQTAYFPTEVENITYSGSALSKDDFQSLIYFVARTDAERAAADEIDKNLLAQKKDRACLPQDVDAEECRNMTLRDCSNANYLQKIIIFDELSGENAKAFISYSNNCIKVMGSGEDLLKAADRIIFMMFGIIKQAP